MAALNFPNTPSVNDIHTENNKTYLWNGVSWINTTSLERTMIIAVSDETTSITTGTGKVTFRSPHAMVLTKIPRATLTTASTSGGVTIDINDGASSVLGVNKLSIDQDEKTSTTAATATTLADTAISDDVEISIDIDSAGTGAKGLKVILFYIKA